MKTIINLSILFCFLFQISTAQNKIKYNAYNIAFNSVFCGLGSGINKKHNETFGKAFLNGFWKGALSGSLNVVSKEMLSNQINKDLNWKYFWGSKIVNSFSNSIFENGIQNKSVLDNYFINIGFVRLSTKDKIQIDPISFLSFGYCLGSGAKLNLSESLLVGTPLFKQTFPRIKTVSKDGNSSGSRPNKFGVMYAQNIIIESGVSAERVYLHEVVHTYQRIQFSTLNKIFFGINSKINNLKYINNDLSIYDLIYFAQRITVGHEQIYFEKEIDFYGF